MLIAWRTVPWDLAAFVAGRDPPDSVREFRRLRAFIPDSELRFGTAIHTGISRLSQLELWIISEIEFGL